MRCAVVWLLLAAPLAPAQVGSGTAGQWLSFTLDRSGPAPLHYDIRIDETTGRGSYRLEPQGPNGGAAPVETPITVEQPLLKRLFAAVPLVQSHRCDAHDKNVAQTGTKTLRYTENGQIFECFFNYSNEDRVNTAAALFIALGETMQYGGRLATKLRFDRLGLDAEMDNLQSALADGRAVDVVNIAPVLLAIQNDDRVMELVRRKAAHLLEGAGATAQSADAGPSER